MTKFFNGLKVFMGLKDEQTFFCLFQTRPDFTRISGSKSVKNIDSILISWHMKIAGFTEEAFMINFVKVSCDEWHKILAVH